MTPSAAEESHRVLTQQEKEELFGRLDELVGRLWGRPQYAEELREVRRLLYLVGNVGVLTKDDLASARGLLSIHGID